MAVDGEDCATAADFVEHVRDKLGMVWTVVRLTEVRCKSVRCCTAAVGKII
jgi:hypothetical protein